MKKFLRLVIPLFSLMAIMLLVTPALADPSQDQNPVPVTPSGPTTIPNPLGDSVTPAELAGRVIKTLLGLSGAAALVVFIYGGVMFMFSGGNSTKVQNAKNTLVYATLGLAIIFASYAILKFVLQVLGGSTGNP